MDAVHEGWHSLDMLELNLITFCKAFNLAYWSAGLVCAKFWQFINFDLGP